MLDQTEQIGPGAGQGTADVILGEPVELPQQRPLEVLDRLPVAGGPKVSWIGPAVARDTAGARPFRSLAVGWHSADLRRTACLSARTSCPSPRRSRSSPTAT